jgi:hypothetical protein
MDVALGPYSKEKYAVRVHGTLAVRTIGESEWRSATPLVHSKSQAQPDYNIQEDDNKNVFYRGKEFLKSGEHLSGAIISADVKWIAVLSYDGKQLPPAERYAGTIGVPGRTKHPRQGELYSDIYNVETGEKVVAVRGAFRGQTADNWFLTAFFLRDRYFFLNTGEHTDQIRQFWICALPGAQDGRKK